MLLEETCFCQDPTPKNLVHVFENVLSLNNFVRSRRYFHCSINLPRGEKLNDDKFLEIANDYLEQMGYGDCPHVIYKHTDMDHDHLHVVCTTVDFDGKKVNDSLNYYRSAEITRKLELKYGLTVTKYDQAKKGNRSLREINRDKYLFSRSIKKAINGDSSDHNKINDELSAEEKEFIKKNDPENQVLLDRLGYERLYEIIEQVDKQYLHVLKKESLISQLNGCLSYCSSMKEFKNELNKLGLYMRLLIGKKGTPYLIYGQENGSYFPEKKLPPQFRHRNLREYFATERPEMNFNQQKSELNKIIKKTLQQESNYNAFKLTLMQQGVQVHEAQNKNGIYGLSFSFRKCAFPLRIKASIIDKSYSYNAIMSHFQNKQKGPAAPAGISPVVTHRGIDDNIPLVNYMSGLMPLGGGTKSKKKEMDDDELDARKRKKKGLGM